MMTMGYKADRDKPDRATHPAHFYQKNGGEGVLPVPTKPCDHAGCQAVGEFRAPKHPAKHPAKQQAKQQTAGEGDAWYWFCLPHVRAYNAAWNYYAGMNSAEMEQAIRFSTHWERPSWPMGQRLGGNAAAQHKATQQLYEAFKNIFAEAGGDAATASFRFESPPAAAEADARYAALQVLGLPPAAAADFPRIKKRYRDLVKRHHPDHLAADATPQAQREATDTIKRLNSAFTLLKAFYGKAGG